MTDAVVHEVGAIAFARNDTPTRGHLLLGAAAEPHDDPLPLAYYAWVIRSHAGDLVVDAGFTAETNGPRPRRLVERPSVALGRLGVDPAAVRVVILTHFHNDHVGDLDGFPSAVFVAQRAEYAHWTAPGAFDAELSKHAERSDIDRLRALHDAGRLRLVDGVTEIVDGVTVHPVGGHTPGMQIVRVRTAVGPVVLASDAAHFFETVEQRHHTAVHLDPDAGRAALDTIDALAAGGIAIAGHDPILLDRFPVLPGTDGRGVRIA